MTEVEENRLRNILAGFRDKDPAAFLRLMFDCVLAKLPDTPEFVASMKRDGDDGQPDLAILLFRGTRPAKWALSRVEGMKRLADEADEE